MSDSEILVSKKLKSILNVRAKLLSATRIWFNQQSFTEVQGPTLIPGIGDWPGYFEVNYFGKKAYLAQGLQPYTDFLWRHWEKFTPLLLPIEQKKCVLFGI